MPWPLISRAQLEARISPAVFRRLLDDDNDGAADDLAELRLRTDASSKVSGWLGPNYALDRLRDVPASELPEEVVRLTLDAAQAILAQRHPEAQQIDGFELMKQTERDLTRVRNNTTTLGIATTTEFSAIEGGDVYSGIGYDADPRAQRFDRTGLF